MGALLSSQLHERLLRNGIMLSGVCLTERPLLGDENILGPGDLMPRGGHRLVWRSYLPDWV